MEKDRVWKVIGGNLKVMIKVVKVVRRSVLRWLEGELVINCNSVGLAYIKTNLCFGEGLFDCFAIE